MRDVLLGGAVLLSAVALVTALTRDGDAKPAPAAPSAPVDVKQLQNQLERQQRRIGELENHVSDLEDQVAALRGRPAASTGMARLQDPRAPREAEAMHIALGVDGGTPPQLQALVADALRQERQKEADERAQQRQRMQTRWLDDTKERLNLSDEQRAKLRDVLDWVEARRTELGEKLANGDVPRSQIRALFEEGRTAFNAKVKEVLTPEQYAEWEKLDENERRPPFGRGAWRGRD